MALAVLNSEPRYKIDEVVDAVIGQRDRVLGAMHENLKGMLVGVVDQIWKHCLATRADLSRVTFEQIRWTQDGHVVIDVRYKGKPFVPGEVRPW